MEHTEKINLFISYSHKDQDPYLPDLLEYLENKYLSELVSVWYDQKISPGSEWDDNIKANLEKADIVILLISIDFLNSEYIDQIELTKSIERHNKGECAVIPLFIRHCELEGYEQINKLQGLPRDKRFISDMDRGKDAAAYTEIQKAIRDKALELLEKKRRTVAKLQTNSTSESLKNEEIIQNSKLVENNDNIYAALIANYKFSNLKGKDIPSVQTNLKELENTFKIELNFKNVFSINNKDCSDIRKELERIFKKCPIDSTLLLYYSGHGLIESNSFYLASEDTELDPEDNNSLYKQSAVSAQNVKDLLEGCKAKHKVLIFDCCYSSAFLNNSLSVNDNSYMKQNFAIKDTYYLFSSIENEVSLYPIDQPEQPTYFTGALLKALKTGVGENYEYCNLEQIFELIKGELENIKDPSGIPVPQVIKPDNGPLEEIKICANPRYVRRSVEKELSVNFESLTNNEIRLWANSRRIDPNIEKALNTLIRRHKNKIRLIKIETGDNNSKDIQLLNIMIQLLEMALENKNDLDTFTDALRSYDKKILEFSNLQNQDNNTLTSKATSPGESTSRSDNALLESKAETEINKSVFEIKNNQDDKGRNQAQFK